MSHPFLNIRPSVWLLWLIVGMIIAISTIGFAPASPHALINADSALYMLMTKDFSGIHDLYYWGQNRAGSAVPMVGRLMTTLLPVDWAASFAQYFFWIIGYACFQRWLTTFFSKVLLAILWFLPCSPIWEFGMIAHPYATAFAFLGMSLVLVDETVRPLMITRQMQRSPRVTTWVETIAGISLMGSIWISDSFLVQLLLLPWLKTPLQLQDPSTEPETQAINKLHLKLFNQIKHGLQQIKPSFYLGLLIGLIGIVIAKQFAPSGGAYGAVMNPIEMLEIWGRVLQDLFQGSRAPIVLFSFLVSITSLYFWRKYTHQPPLPRFWKYCVLSAGMTTGLILISQWFYLSSIPPVIAYRYFAQVQAWLSIILCLSLGHGLGQRSSKLDGTKLDGIKLTGIKVGAIVINLFIGAVVVWSVSTSYPVLLATVNAPGVHRTPKLVADLRQLPPAGVIGDYWTAYLWCGTDSRFSCTPHDKAMVRQPRYVKDVQGQAQVYIVKTRWLDRFPDRLVQFGQTLERTGPSQKVGEWEVSLYRWQKS